MPRHTHIFQEPVILFWRIIRNNGNCLDFRVTDKYNRQCLVMFSLRFSEDQNLTASLVVNDLQKLEEINEKLIKEVSKLKGFFKSIINKNSINVTIVSDGYQLSSNDLDSILLMLNIADAKLQFTSSQYQLAESRIERFQDFLASNAKLSCNVM